MNTETEFLACLLVCGPPDQYLPSRGSNWPKVYRWHKDNYPYGVDISGGIDFYRGYLKWWREQIHES